jgi:hypothetical protein
VVASPLQNMQEEAQIWTQESAVTGCRPTARAMARLLNNVERTKILK